MRKLLGLTLLPRLPCSFFQEQVPNMFFSPNVLDSKELLNMDNEVHILYGLSPYMDFLPEMLRLMVHIYIYIYIYIQEIIGKIGILQMIFAYVIYSFVYRNLLV